MKRDCLRWIIDAGVAVCVQDELISSQYEAQRAALEQMTIRLSSLQYPGSANRGQCTQYLRSNR